MTERDAPHPDGDRAAVVADYTVARWLGESGELMSRYSDAVGQHVGRMASVNADLRSALARERRRAAALPGGLLLRGAIWLALTLAVAALVLARPWGRSFGAWGQAAWRYRRTPARARWSPGKGERG